MKKAVFVTTLLIAVCSFTQAQLLTEDFNYTATTALTANGWSQTGTSATNPILVANSGLTYTGYAGSGVGNAATLANNGQDLYLGFASQTTGSVYASLLVNVSATLNGAPYVGDYFFHMTQTGGSTSAFFPRLFARTADNGNLTFGITKTSVSSPNWPVWADSIYVLNTTYLIVVKYTFNTGSTTDDAVSLFIFQDPTLPGSEPGTPTVGPITSTQADAPALAAVALRQGSSTNAATVVVDGIHVATSWSQAPLPVELLSFTASAHNSKVDLNWTTKTETNNYGFEIERKSINSWQKVGFVEGNGTTNAPHAYSFTDNSISSGVHSYRLKQIDRDGKFEYSKVVEATIGLTPNTILLGQNYPNPFNPETNIEFAVPVSGRTTLKVYSMLGQEVATLVNGNVEAGIIQHASFKGTSLPSGLYFYTLRSGSFVDTKKMMMLK